MKKSLPCLLICLFYFACNNAKNNSPATSLNATIPEMQVDIKNDWGGNITLNINSAEKLTPEITKYKILSTYQDRPVGFWMQFKKPEKKQNFVSDGIVFKRMGDTSDNFLNAIADVYHVKRPNAAFTDSIAVNYADLESMLGQPQKPGDWIAAQTKLFFPVNDDEAELFLDIDKNSQSISFSEKDSSYRTEIIQALTKRIK